MVEFDWVAAACYEMSLEQKNYSEKPAFRSMCGLMAYTPPEIPQYIGPEFQVNQYWKKIYFDLRKLVGFSKGGAMHLITWIVLSETNTKQINQMRRLFKKLTGETKLRPVHEFNPDSFNGAMRRQIEKDCFAGVCSQRQALSEMQSLLCTLPLHGLPQVQKQHFVISLTHEK